MSENATETKWIEETLIPKLLKQLGESSDDVRWEISFPEHSFYLSYICFLNLIFDSEKKNGTKGKENEMKLVIKRPPVGKAIGDNMNMEKQFHNEILFYTKVARGSSRFPRCFYTAEGTLQETVIVIENICELGYKICSQTFDVPFEYVLAAAEEIGRFHALGYVMKEQEPEEFRKVVNGIQESRFVEDSWLHNFINIIAPRPIEWLRKNNCDPAFCDKLEKHLSNGYELMKECLKPVEPLATLSHGDFTRNNVFFRKTDGKVEGMLFDFALMTYSSPAIDLSTFLHLNCTTTDRTAKFKDIFGVYHKALITYLREAGIKDLAKYSYDNLLADYKRGCIFGYLVGSFYTPVIRGFVNADFEQYQNDLTAAAELLKVAGGDVMTEEYGKMLLDLKDNGCLDHLCC